MSIPTLEQRPTHKLLPLLRSEVSRITHRRLVRVMALILLGGIVVISIFTFFMHSKQLASAQEQLESNRAEQQRYWLECADSAPDPDLAEKFCGREPATQPLERFDWGQDDRYKAYEVLPIALIGAAIAATGVAFLIGASSGGAEWSSRSMTLQLLFEPRRLRLLTIKWLGVVLSTTVLAAVAMVVAVGFGALTAQLRGTWDGQFAPVDELRDNLGQTMMLMGLRGLVLVAAGATIGYAIAMLVRNTGASLGVAFVYFVVLENGIRFALMRYGSEPYMLSTNAVAFLFPGGLEVPGEEAGPYAESTSVDLTNLRSFVTLSAYTALLSLPAAWSFSRRDVG
ncbi:MAG: ABC transporter permease [Actinomycetia bacterium]|nr:ABC transporter permease [Actinomycetes bacterium]